MSREGPQARVGGKIREGPQARVGKSGKGRRPGWVWRNHGGR